jgi:hypothetical protein
MTRYAQAYLTLSLDEIAARVGMASRSALVSILAQMVRFTFPDSRADSAQIHDKEVHASIDMVAGTVSFDSDIEQVCTFICTTCGRDRLILAQFESTHSTQVLQERIAAAISVCVLVWSYVAA